MKRCPRCKQPLLLAAFSKNKSKKDGLSAWCKNCERKYRQEYKEKIAKHNRKYYQKTKAKWAKYGRKYRQGAHKEKTAEYQREYNKTHKAEKAEYNRKYRQARPEKMRAYSRRRKARKRGSGIKKFPDIEIFERDGWICQICGIKINRRLKWPHPRSKSLDHIVPISQGGHHTQINVQAAHLHCNLSKRARRGYQLRLIK